MRRFLVFACLGLGCTLRGDGERMDESRELAAFAVLEVFDEFVARVQVDAGLPPEDPVTLTVSADGNALERIFSELHGEGTLSIAVDPNNLTKLSLTPEVEVTVPALRRAYAADTAVVEVVDARGELSLEARESATLALTGGEELTLTAAAHEQATLIVSGEGPTLTIEAYDTATVDARRFVAAEAIVYARGQGEVLVCATEKLTVRGAGAEYVTLDCG